MDGNKRKRDSSDDTSGFARITYHADSRAFERLFKERSLEELKDAVRRKLGLESGVIVRLKQIRPNMLLDLDDDDDFEALRSQALRSTLSTIDIKVTVEKSLQPVQPAAPQAADRPQSPTISATQPKPPAKRRKVATGNGASSSTPQPAALDVPIAVEPQKQPAKPENKKRKAVSKVVASMPTPTQKDTEAPVPDVSGGGKGVDGPPKKRQKKAKDTVPAPNEESSNASEPSKTTEPPKSSEVVKTKDGIHDKAKEPIEGSSAEAAPAPKKRVQKTSKSKAQAGRESEAASGGAVHGEEQPSKPSKPSKAKKQPTDKDVAKTPKVTKKSTKTATHEAPGTTVVPVNDPSSGEGSGTTLLAPKKSSKKKLTGEGGTGQSEKQRSSSQKTSEAADECTFMDSPMMSNPTLLDAESWDDFLQSFSLGIAQLQNEQSHNSTQDETSSEPEEPKKVKKSTALPAQEPTPPTSAEPSTLDDGDMSSSEEVVQSSSTDQPCPVCLERPFHVRYKCPIVLQGSGAIQKRLDELKQSNSRDHKHLIEELEGLLRRNKGTDKTLSAPSAPPPLTSVPSTNPAVLPPTSLDSPVASTPSEESSPVTSSDEDEEEQTERVIFSPKPSRTNKKIGYGDDVLEAVIRGPAPNLGVARMLKELGEEEERAAAQLEEDAEERSDERISHTETRFEEDDEDGSPSPPTPLTGNRSLRNGGLGNESEGSNPTKTTPAVPKKLPREKSSGAYGHNADGEDTDPIEPAEELAYPSDGFFPEGDPIEPATPAFNKIETTSHSTPKPSVASTQPKARGTVTANHDAEHPVPGSSLIPGGKKPLRKAVGFSASQEVIGTRRPHSPEPLPSTLPIPTPKNSKGKATTRGSKVPKTPAKVAQKALKMNNKGEPAKAAGRILSPAVWETIPEATPSVQLDELLSNSPQVEGNTLTPIARKPSDVAIPTSRSTQDEERERLFDLTASQIPFPYSQYTTPSAPAPEPSSDSEEQEETLKPPPERPVRKNVSRGYRSLTELASEASSLFSPSLAAPKATAGSRNGQKKKSLRDDGDSDDASSSSSQSDDAATSTHIPKGRRASSVVPTKKRRGLLAGL